MKLLETHTVTLADILHTLRSAGRGACDPLLRVMEREDPETAQTIREAIAQVDNERRARRGADPLWVEHVEEREGEWWA